MVDRHDDLHTELDGSLVSRHQLGLVLHLERQMEQAGLAPELRGHQHLPVAADQRLLRQLGEPDVVVRVAVAHEAGVDGGLLEALLQSHDSVVELHRAVDVGDEEVRVAEAARAELGVCHGEFSPWVSIWIRD